MDEMHRLTTLSFLLLAGACAAACAPSSGTRWVGELPESPPVHPGGDGFTGVDSATPVPSPGPVPDGPPGAMRSAPIAVQDFGDAPRAIYADAQSEVYRNTYYDFPREGAGAKEATIFDATCAPIAKVTADFHDRVCVQGSGRIASGETVSFAKRDCACAAVCPRTGQKLCYERLDPARFPSGRGATGRAITPLRTVAVDSTVIPLGTRLHIAEFAGLPRPDGSLHDGCFIAEDRGLKVVGKQIDVFTGDPTITARWNTLVPSNTGVHVRQNDPRCAAAR